MKMKDYHSSNGIIFWCSVLNEISMGGGLWHIPGNIRTGTLLRICTAAAGADFVESFLLIFMRKKGVPLRK